jgi:peptidoglycan/LPS O-acetylase OafA/YrhL
MKSGHLRQIDGLRGYLALWVAVGHALQLAGYLALPAGLGFLGNGGYAVEVFIIISGFVITHLLLKRRETYGQYITRRFFRLYPIYLTGCAIGYLTFPWFVAIVHRVPWSGTAEWRRFAGLADQLELQTSVNLLPHLIAHATMLHGLLPRQVLERASLTFLPAAWSISLEWQFYLVAPLVLFALRSRRGGSIAALCALAAYAAYDHGLLGDYYAPADFRINSSIFGASPFFAVGIASRCGYEFLKQLRVSPLFSTAAALLLMCAAGRFSVSLAIWCAFYSYLLWADAAPRTGSVFQRLTAGRIPLLIGSMSYSIYLVHRPLQIVLLHFAMPYVTVGHASMLCIQFAAILLTLPVSWVLYRLVELPGQALGRRAAALLVKRPVAVSSGASG